MTTLQSENIKQRLLGETQLTFDNILEITTSLKSVEKNSLTLSLGNSSENFNKGFYTTG